MSNWYGAIEAGGTKFVCAVARHPNEIYAKTRIPTTTPAETLGAVVDFFQSVDVDIAAVGIGAFGPIEPNRAKPEWGYITKTPKPNWSSTDVAGPIQRALHVPVGFDTDVNVAALGELRWGAAQGLNSAVYFTIGTGVGGGAIIDGKMLGGLLHPEMGHMRLPHDTIRDPFGGICPFHGDCFEGLACGPAIEARWGKKAQDLPPEHPAWELEASYIGQAMANIICILSPERIVLGGGVMHQQHLFPMVRAEVQRLLNGYVQRDEILNDIESYIVPPGLGDLAGIGGAIALAIDTHAAQ